MSPDKSEVPAGGFTAVTLTVGHGCEESPTRQIVVQVPDSINSVTPGIVPGWDITVDTVALPEPIEGSHGEQVTEREANVTFTAQAGNELPDGFRMGFTLGFQAPDTPGEYLFFKTIQICTEGQTEWIEEYTGDGEEPEHPSPVVLVAAAAADGHGGGDEEEEMADSTESTPTSEVTEAEVDTANGGDEAAAADTDDDDGSTGTTFGILGFVLGAAGLATGRAALVSTRKSA